MPTKIESTTVREFTGLDEPLQAQLPSFELFFKTFGFKRVHGRVWGLLVLAGQPLSSREISHELSLSQGATSTSLNELTEWGAIKSEFDTTRRCHVHSPVGNTLSIVATVFRRREQVVFGNFKQAAQSTLKYVRGAYGEKDPRVFTLRSIISSLEIAEAVMQLVFSSVERALGDSESILSRAVNTALKIGMKVPARLTGGAPKHPLAANGNGSLTAAILSNYSDEEALDEDESDEREVDETNGDEAPERSEHPPARSEHAQARSEPRSARARDARRGATPPRGQEPKSSTHA